MSDPIHPTPAGLALGPTAAPSSVAPSGADVSAYPLAHVGLARELLAISLVNLLYKVITLGVYHFWAKTRVRRYVWSHTLFAGEAFEYTGRGKELLIGYLIAMAILVPLIIGYNLLEAYVATEPFLAMGLGLGLYGTFIFLTGFATYSAWRYLLSRTRWRSIRFALGGRARDHGWRLLGYSLLTTVTFGFYFPYQRNKQMRHLVSNAWFGSERFQYDGPDRALLRRFLLCGLMMTGVVVVCIGGAAGFMALIAPYLQGVDEVSTGSIASLGFALGLLALMVPALAVVWIWYKAGELRFFVAHTRLGDVRFALDLTTRQYLWLTITNLAALILTLGLAYPWVVVRLARALARSLRMDGMLELGRIEQSSQAAPRSGEGLADAFDLGAI